MRLPHVALLSIAALALACSTSATTISDTAAATSIVVRSESLVGTYGCGLGDAKVYKYAVAVAPPSDSAQLPLGAVYDCFADATFAGLSASKSGTQPFTLKVFAFRAADYDKASATILGAANAGDAATLDPLATWRTTCTATQQANVTVLARCGSLR